MSTASESQTKTQESQAVQLRLMIEGFRNTQLIYVAAELGIADLLADGPKSSDELAKSVDVHPRSLYRVLRALASQNIFAETADGRFEHTPLSEPLKSGTPDSVLAKAIFEGQEWRWRPWGDALYSVKTGKPSFPHAFNMGLWEYFELNPDMSEIFDQSMAENSRSLLADILASYDFSGIGKIIDVGSGSGALIAGILKQYPEAHGILFDLPAAAESAKGFLDSQGLGDRCDAVGGDFLQSVPGGGDAYILKAVVHNWDDERALAILRNCRSVMADGGRILVIECVVQPENETPAVKLSDVNMMLMLGTLDRTEAELQNLLVSAGFAPTRVVTTRSLFSIVEATPV